MIQLIKNKNKNNSTVNNIIQRWFWIMLRDGMVSEGLNLIFLQLSGWNSLAFTRLLWSKKYISDCQPQPESAVCSAV